MTIQMKIIQPNMMKWESPSNHHFKRDRLILSLRTLQEPLKSFLHALKKLMDYLRRTLGSKIKFERIACLKTTLYKWEKETVKGCLEPAWRLNIQISTIATRRKREAYVHSHKRSCQMQKKYFPNNKSQKAHLCRCQILPLYLTGRFKTLQ